jgi:hypothetical protein
VNGRVQHGEGTTDRVECHRHPGGSERHRRQRLTTRVIGNYGTVTDGDGDETWTEEQDARYARRVGELHLEGHEEFEVERIAAAEVNAERDSDEPSE